jgi:hypothetical protein
MLGDLFKLGVVGVGGYLLSRAARKAPPPPPAAPPPTPAAVLRGVMDGPDRIGLFHLKGPADRPVRVGKPYHVPYSVN